MKLNWLLFPALLLAYSTRAQDARSTFPKRNSIYAEVMGKGPYYSANYDRVIRVGRKWSYSVRVGFSIVADGISLPLGINAFTTPGNHHLELGLGLTPYVDHYRSFLAKEDLSDKYLYIVPSIGYRYQKPGGGLFFTAAFMPYLFLDPPSDNVLQASGYVRTWAGLGLGVSF